MGLILDSTVLIAAERKGRTARQTLADLFQLAPGERFGLSVISLFELNHGTFRAQTQKMKDRRGNFLNELISFFPVFPVTNAIALRAGQLDGEMATQGRQIAMADLLIGATALELGYGVVTHNIRHFRSIPDLNGVAVQ